MTCNQPPSIFFYRLSFPQSACIKQMEYKDKKILQQDKKAVDSDSLILQLQEAMNRDPIQLLQCFQTRKTGLQALVSYNAAIIDLANKKQTEIDEASLPATKNGSVFVRGHKFVSLLRQHLQEEGFKTWSWAREQQESHQLPQPAVVCVEFHDQLDHGGGHFDHMESDESIRNYLWELHDLVVKTVGGVRKPQDDKSEAQLPILRASAGVVTRVNAKKPDRIDILASPHLCLTVSFDNRMDYNLEYLMAVENGPFDKRRTHFRLRGGIITCSLLDYIVSDMDINVHHILRLHRKYYDFQRARYPHDDEPATIPDREVGIVTDPRIPRNSVISYVNFAKSFKKLEEFWLSEFQQQRLVIRGDEAEQIAKFYDNLFCISVLYHAVECIVHGEEEVQTKDPRLLAEKKNQRLLAEKLLYMNVSAQDDNADKLFVQILDFMAVVVSHFVMQIGGVFYFSTKEQQRQVIYRNVIQAVHAWMSIHKEAQEKLQ